MARNKERLEVVGRARTERACPQAETSRASVAQQDTAQQKQPSLWRELGTLGLKIVAIAVVCALIFTLFYGFDRNKDPDMTPLVKDGDLVVFYRLDKNYVAGDLVVLRYKGELETRRVVAGAGDTVDITGEGLVVNGALQQEPEIYQKTSRYAQGASFPLKVGKGQVFVLGDARENATDSRVYGPVNTKDTYGTVITLIRRRNF